MSQLSSHYIGSLNTNNIINPNAAAGEKPGILAWLSPPDPKLRQAIRNRGVENVGGWLLQTEEFRSWYAGSEGGESHSAVLFCYGGPGVGKFFIW